VTDRRVLHDTVERLARSVCESLASHSRRGRTVTLKIRLQPFKTYTRSKTLPDRTCDPEHVVATARELLDRFDPQAPVRLVGVGMAGLGEDPQATRSSTTTASETGGSLTLDLG
jgi:DNA polymerase-4